MKRRTWTGTLCVLMALCAVLVAPLAFAQVSPLNGPGLAPQEVDQALAWSVFDQVPTEQLDVLLFLLESNRFDTIGAKVVATQRPGYYLVTARQRPGGDIAAGAAWASRMASHYRESAAAWSGADAGCAGGGGTGGQGGDILGGGALIGGRGSGPPHPPGGGGSGGGSGDDGDGGDDGGGGSGG